MSECSTCHYIYPSCYVSWVHPRHMVRMRAHGPVPHSQWIISKISIIIKECPVSSHGSVPCRIAIGFGFIASSAIREGTGRWYTLSQSLYITQSNHRLFDWKKICHLHDHCHNAHSHDMNQSITFQNMGSLYSNFSIFNEDQDAAHFKQKKMDGSFWCILREGSSPLSTLILVAYTQEFEIKWIYK